MGVGVAVTGAAGSRGLTGGEASGALATSATAGRVTSGGAGVPTRGSAPGAAPGATVGASGAVGGAPGSRAAPNPVISPGRAVGALEVSGAVGRVPRLLAAAINRSDPISSGVLV